MKAVSGFSWSNLATNLLPFCYLGLLVFFPSQFGYHFWPEFSFLSGLRIDYLSPTFYLSDLFLIGLVIGITPQLLTHLREKRRTLVVLGFLLYLFLTSLFSLSPLNSLYGLLRWSGYALFALATWHYSQDKRMLTFSLLALSLGVIYSTLLALSQFILQHSVGGFFYLLGERTFSGSTPGIANASLNGTLVLRPYASFPHPNVLAGYLLLSFWILWIYRKFIVKPWQHFLLTLALVLSPLALFISLSRTAILLWVVLMVVFVSLFWRRRNFLHFRSVVSLLGAGGMGMIFLLLPRFMTLSLQDEAVMLRLSLLVKSWEIFNSSPFVGVGLKNFLVVLSSYPLSSLPHSSLQPVHNIFVLLLVEIGLVGLSWVGPFLFSLGKRVVSESGELLFLKLALTLSVVGIGMVDHYFYTLHQGQLLLSLTLGILWQRSLPHPDRSISFAPQKKQISRKRTKNKPHKRNFFEVAE